MFFFSLTTRLFKVPYFVKIRNSSKWVKIFGFSKFAQFICQHSSPWRIIHSSICRIFLQTLSLLSLIAKKKRTKMKIGRPFVSLGSNEAFENPKIAKFLCFFEGRYIHTRQSDFNTVFANCLHFNYRLIYKRSVFYYGRKFVNNSKFCRIVEFPFFVVNYGFNFFKKILNEKLYFLQCSFFVFF